MAESKLPGLPGVDAASAPAPDDPGYEAWVEAHAFSPEGVDVDRMLIWESLQRIPTEHLAVIEEHAATLLRLRNGRRPEIV